VKSFVVWDIKPCILLKVKRRFGGILSSIFGVGEQTKQETSMNQALLNYLLLAGFLHGLFYDPEEGGKMFLRNVD
jgi:hypothetical protein